MKNNRNNHTYYDLLISFSFDFHQHFTHKHITLTMCARNYCNLQNVFLLLGLQSYTRMMMTTMINNNNRAKIKLNFFEMFILLFYLFCFFFLSLFYFYLIHRKLYHLASSSTLVVYIYFSCISFIYPFFLLLFLLFLSLCLPVSHYVPACLLYNLCIYQVC